MGVPFSPFKRFQATLLLVFCKAVYVKAQQMDMKSSVNIINMHGTGNVNDKLRERKVENSVKVFKKRTRTTY